MPKQRQAIWNDSRGVARGVAQSLSLGRLEAWDFVWHSVLSRSFSEMKERPSRRRKGGIMGLINSHPA